MKEDLVVAFDMFGDRMEISQDRLKPPPNAIMVHETYGDWLVWVPLERRRGEG